MSECRKYTSSIYEVHSPCQEVQHINFVSACSPRKLHIVGTGSTYVWFVKYTLQWEVQIKINKSAKKYR